MGAAMSQRAMAGTEPRPPAASPAPAAGPPPLPQADWYYAESNERRGPISLSALQQLAGAGSVGATTLVWRAGMKDWAPASSVSEVASSIKR